MPKQLISRLKVKTIASLGPGAHCDGMGLYLLVAPAGTRSWAVRYKSPVTGKRRELGIGSLLTVSLADARDRALKVRLAVLNGTDPIEERAEQRAKAVATIKSPTLAECIKRYVINYGSKWRPGTKRNFINSMEKHVVSKLGHIPVGHITTQHILTVFGDIWNMTTADVMLSRVATVLDWATHQGMRTGENPAAYKTIKHLLPARQVKERVNHPSLPWQELPAFVAALRQGDGINYRAAELQILTATRPLETAEARWSEFNAERTLWTIPAKRMKGRVEHVIPLSQRAREIILEMEAIRQNEYVFPGRYQGTSLGQHSLISVDQLIRPDITAHGFRSTLYGWVRDATDYDDRMVDVQLAHKVDDATKAAYARARMIDKRRAFLEHWSRVCGGEEPIDNVVDIRAARA